MVTREELGLLLRALRDYDKALTRRDRAPTAREVVMTRELTERFRTILARRPGDRP